jgi:hypothetical protein
MKWQPIVHRAREQPTFLYQSLSATGTHLAIDTVGAPRYRDSSQHQDTVDAHCVGRKHTSFCIQHQPSERRVGRPSPPTIT